MSVAVGEGVRVRVRDRVSVTRQDNTKNNTRQHNTTKDKTEQDNTTGLWELGLIRVR